LGVSNWRFGLAFQIASGFRIPGSVHDRSIDDVGCKALPAVVQAAVGVVVYSPFTRIRPLSRAFEWHQWLFDWLGTYGEIAKFCSGAVGAVDRVDGCISLYGDCCMPFSLDSQIEHSFFLVLVALEHLALNGRQTMYIL